MEGGGVAPGGAGPHAVDVGREDLQPLLELPKLAGESVHQALDLVHVARRIEVALVHPIGGGDAVEALKTIDLDIPRGSIFGLLGPNGAGKSTFINILAGLVNKTSGTVTIWGRDIDRERRAASAAIGIVPQELAIDPFFTPRQTLDIQAGFYGVPRRERVVGPASGGAANEPGGNVVGAPANEPGGNVVGAPANEPQR